MKNCERCYQSTDSWIMSRFNTQEICLPCESKEIAHPLYKKAVEAEHAALKGGNYNYPGIGKPEDL